MTTRSRTWKARVPTRGSRAVGALERAWRKLRKLHPAIPPAVLTLVDVRSRGWVRGYFARSTWRVRGGSAHEVAVSPDLIAQPASLLVTLLHEAAHAVLHDTGFNGGVGSTRYYHKTEFRDQCRTFGLRCEFLNTRYGWTLTDWPASGVPPVYRPIVAALGRSLPAGTGGKAAVRRRGRPLPVSGHTPLVCSCTGRNRTIYVKKTVLKDGGIRCQFCRREFRPVVG